MNKAPGDRLGLSITGGAGTPCGNVIDITDEGIFISRVSLPVSHDHLIVTFGKSAITVNIMNEII